ncbi:hypothetical protein ABIB77_002719 [Bradyrhizobium sp. i1.14.1]|uniref:hypothetical protein n=1 Tax=Bradyrhizobium sp. i1.14.1 TaxID=3156360 RepID=UPI003D1B9DA0
MPDNLQLNLLPVIDCHSAPPICEPLQSGTSEIEAGRPAAVIANLGHAPLAQSVQSWIRQDFASPSWG